MQAGIILEYSLLIFLKVTLCQVAHFAVFKSYHCFVEVVNTFFNQVEVQRSVLKILVEAKVLIQLTFLPAVLMQTSPFLCIK